MFYREDTGTSSRGVGVLGVRNGGNAGRVMQTARGGGFLFFFVFSDTLHESGVVMYGSVTVGE
jgi:hypothetical protein